MSYRRNNNNYNNMSVPWLRRDDGSTGESMNSGSASFGNGDFRYSEMQQQQQQQQRLPFNNSHVSNSTSLNLEQLFRGNNNNNNNDGGSFSSSRENFPRENNFPQPSNNSYFGDDNQDQASYIYNSIGTVTKVGSHWSLVNDQVLFNRSVCRGDELPTLGSRVLFEAVPNLVSQQPYKWNAKRIQLMTPSSQNSTSSQMQRMNMNGTAGDSFVNHSFGGGGSGFSFGNDSFGGQRNINNVRSSSMQQRGSVGNAGGQQSRGSAQVVSSRQNNMMAAPSSAYSRGQTNRNAVQNSRDSSQVSRGSGQVSRGSMQVTRGTGQVTRGTGQATRGTGQATRGTGQATRTTGQATRTTGQATRTTGQATRTTGQATRTTGQATRTTGQATRTTGQATRTTGQATRTTGQATRTTGQATRTTGQATRGTGQVNRATGQTTRGSGEVNRTSAVAPQRNSINKNTSSPAQIKAKATGSTGAPIKRAAAPVVAPVGDKKSKTAAENELRAATKVVDRLEKIPKEKWDEKQHKSLLWAMDVLKGNGESKKSNKNETKPSVQKNTPVKQPQKVVAKTDESTATSDKSLAKQRRIAARVIERIGLLPKDQLSPKDTSSLAWAKSILNDEEVKELTTNEGKPVISHKDRRAAAHVMDRLNVVPADQLTEKQKASLAWATSVFAVGEEDKTSKTATKRQAGDGEIGAPNVKKSRQSGKPILPGDQHIIVSVVDKSNVDGSISQEKWQKLEIKLAAVFPDILKKHPGVAPCCRNVVWYRDRVRHLVACADQRSVDLYKIGIAQIGKELWAGAKLEVAVFNQIPSELRVRAWIPAEPSDPQKVLDIIKECNPELHTAKWVVAQLDAARGHVRSAIFVVDSKSLVALSSTGGVISYGFSAITIEEVEDDEDEEPPTIAVDDSDTDAVDDTNAEQDEVENAEVEDNVEEDDENAAEEDDEIEAHEEDNSALATDA